MIGRGSLWSKPIRRIAVYSMLMCACLTPYAFAVDGDAEDVTDETQSALQLKENGFKACAHAVDDIGHFVFRGDFAFLNLWNVRLSANQAWQVTITQNIQQTATRP